MKLVAAKDIFNVRKISAKVAKDARHFRHENMIHKGHRFEVGSADKYTELTNEQQEVVGLLIKHECAVMDSKENAENGVIDRIDAEAKAEFAAHKAAITPQPSIAEVVAAAVAKALAPAPSEPAKAGK